MKNKTFFQFNFLKILMQLFAFFLLLVGLYAIIILSFGKKHWFMLAGGMICIALFAFLIDRFGRPVIVFKNNKMIVYGGLQDFGRKKEINCSDVKSCEMCRGRDRSEHIVGCPRPYSGGVRKITLYAKMKKQSPLHISLDGFTKKQRQKIVAEIEKRRDYYAPIIEKERQEKIKAKLQEQKDREKQ